MKATHVLIAMLLVSLFFAPAVFAQSPDSANQSAAASAASAAEVPRLVKFSGTLLDAQDRPMAGPVGVTFALHAQQTGGAALWLETQNVTPDAHGNYTVLLGANSANGVPAELFASGEARWLEVQVERQAEQPRILLVSVPYALKAKDAETLGGRPASAFLTTETLAGSPAGTSPTAGSTALPSSKAQSTPKKAASTPQPAVACTSVTSDGTATANSVAKFTTACNIENSAITETGGNVGIGTTAPIRALDIEGGTNTAILVRGPGTHGVQLTGDSSSGRLGQDLEGFFFSSDTNGKVIKFLTNNGALNEWMRITSVGNIGIGTKTPAATLDVVGTLNLPATTSATMGVISLGGTRFAHNFGTENAFFGVSAGNFTMTGSQNAAFGFLTFNVNTTGSFSSAFGNRALVRNTTGISNSAFGYLTLNANTTGGSNSAFGEGALFQVTGGSNNIAIGAGAGNNFLTSESNNIDIGNQGVTTESNTVRIGSVGTHTAAFIAGISGVNVSGAPVLVSSTGQLGVAVSSQRFKHEIADMAGESNLLMKLRPVSFYYKPEYDDTQTRQYGLVAEEVAQVAPQLVVFDRDGAPQTVRYHFVNAMLLNEVQKQRQLVEEQQSTIARQQAEIQDLAARLAKLEALVAPAP
ncbi:MAG: tail fiber domain-containing protein [Candidatus Acidiferrales bacterium]